MPRKLMAVLVASAVCFCAITPASAAEGSSEQGQPAPIAASSGVVTPRNQAPLSPGKAAGIKEAQGNNERVWNIIGISFIAGVGIAMAVVHGGDNNIVVSTTTTGH